MVEKVLVPVLVAVAVLEIHGTVEVISQFPGTADTVLLEAPPFPKLDWGHAYTGNIVSSEMNS